MDCLMDPRVLAIAIISGLIGWGTNAVAVRMLFHPLKRVGWRRLSWQGILPANAERMATICVRLMTSRLLDMQALFERIQPARISALLSPTLEKHAEEIVEKVLARRFPKLWEALPERVRTKAREGLRAEVPTVVSKLMTDLREDLGRYIDIEALVVQSFVGNRALLNELFWNCGRKEFLFIARSGLLFGGLFGMVQAAVWLLVQPDWFLPVTGLLVGWATNWLALKMIFEPLEPRKWGPIRWQGLFLRRQNEVSSAYASFFAENILTADALVRAVVRGPAADRVVELLQRYVSQAVDHASGAARPLVQLSVGTDEWLALKGEVSEQLADLVPRELDRVHDYAEEALDLETELRENLRSLPPAEFEQVLRPIFRMDEDTLIAVGAALGGVAGVLQWVLMTL